MIVLEQTRTFSKVDSIKQWFSIDIDHIQLIDYVPLLSDAINVRIVSINMKTSEMSFGIWKKYLKKTFRILKNFRAKCVMWDFRIASHFRRCDDAIFFATKTLRPRDWKNIYYWVFLKFYFRSNSVQLIQFFGTYLNYAGFAILFVYASFF